ncbi:MAG: hypothetical protein M1324_00390 [Patescibacteria group bacterium]|nr:hypothetical protein [Patescibacteria group bacterium]MCL5410301.1 hypothetical protein [Patescibacteria group bacterium]
MNQERLFSTYTCNECPILEVCNIVFVAPKPEDGMEMSVSDCPTRASLEIDIPKI